MNVKTETITTACQYLTHGGVIAYPTEAVFGFGCDPLNEDAVKRILGLKDRPEGQGLILIANSTATQIPFIEDSSAICWSNIKASWPGPVTWIFPARRTVPSWLTGPGHTIALRVSNHPVVIALCKQFGRPIVSTSANARGEAPLKEYSDVVKAFSQKIDFVVPGEVLGLERPSRICHAVTGKVVRE